MQLRKAEWYVIAYYGFSLYTRTNIIRSQLPLGLLNAAQGHPMLVELKNGETLNGHLVQCDTWMNLTLKEVVQTSPVCLCSFSHTLGRNRIANI